ncbi:MAG: hypothetical protein JST86_10885 [Bacteroidetes bacterium]|nr:hypothetical protein [Bacteroidota bacterium]
MIEVFKTNIICPEKAAALLQKIHRRFGSLQANFDLDDCDHILRVLYNDSKWQAEEFICWLNENECIAEILL